MVHYVRLLLSVLSYITVSSSSSYRSSVNRCISTSCGFLRLFPAFAANAAFLRNLTKKASILTISLEIDRLEMGWYKLHKCGFMVDFFNKGRTRACLSWGVKIPDLRLHRLVLSKPKPAQSMQLSEIFIIYCLKNCSKSIPKY